MGWAVQPNTMTGQRFRQATQQPRDRHPDVVRGKVAIAGKLCYPGR